MCCRFHVVLAQSLQERRTLRIVTAWRVVLQVSSILHSWSHSIIPIIAITSRHPCSRCRLVHIVRRACRAIAREMTAARPLADGRSGPPKARFMLREHRARGRNIYVIVNKFRIPIAALLACSSFVASRVIRSN